MERTSSTKVTEKQEVPWSGVGVTYTEEEIALVSNVMRETRDTLTQGKYLKQFEDAFCKFNGNEYALGVSTCTAALEMAAVLSGLQPGDEVIIPSHTYCASAIPFARHGGKIIWADIDPKTLVVTPETLAPLISNKTKVIVVVHLYGLAADMPSIMALAKKNNIKVVEDCAQAIGAKSHGQRVGTYGDFGCFSFHTHKNISTLGEGGILTIKDGSLLNVAKGIRHNGHEAYPDREQYWVPAMVNVKSHIDGLWPFNHCIGEVQAALGAKILDRVDGLIAIRAKRAAVFKKALEQYSELQFQVVPESVSHAWHLLPAKYDGSKTGKTNHDFISRMWNTHRVKVIRQYYPLDRYPLFVDNGFGTSNCPNTDAFYDNMVSFPFHSWMEDEMFDSMIESTIETCKTLRK